MPRFTRTRHLAIAFALALGAVTAHADGDIYSRLMTMQELKANQQGMVTKEAFLDMVGKMWDAKVAEKKAAGAMLSPIEIAELQKILGRRIAP